MQDSITALPFMRTQDVAVDCIEMKLIATAANATELVKNQGEGGPPQILRYLDNPRILPDLPDERLQIGKIRI
jgi:hypothetical protein